MADEQVSKEPQASQAPQADASEHGLEVAMGRMLQIGVTLAALVVLAGGILYLRSSSGPRPDYSAFHGAPLGLTTIHGIVGGLAKFDPMSIIAFGILLLIATPVCRVLFGVVGFAVLKDRFYAMVSGLVLAILLYSFWRR